MFTVWGSGLTVWEWKETVGLQGSARNEEFFGGIEDTERTHPWFGARCSRLSRLGPV